MSDSNLSYSEVMVLVWVLWTAALFMTVFRGSLQLSRQGRLYADDYLVLVGLVSLTALSAVITRLLPQFYLVDQYTKAATVDPLTPLPLPPGEFAARTVESLKLTFCQMLLFWTTLWAAKFSILFFIRRLVDGLPRYIMWWWACFTVVMLLYLACMLSNFLTCKPLTQYWSPTGCSRPEDMPRSDASIKFATGADIAADLLTMILPLHLIRNLTISHTHKFGLVIVFSLGAIIIAFALVRLVKVTKATSDTIHDPTIVASGPLLLSMWSHIESTVAIIVATLPAFRFLLNRNHGSTTNASDRQDNPTIGGSRMSLASRKWRRGAARLDGSESEGSALGSGSQTELRPVGRVNESIDTKLERATNEPAD